MTDEDLNILARTLYGEARGEYRASGPASLIAVANVIMNRLKKGKRFGKTVTEVCLKPKQFSCWNENDPNFALLKGNGLLKEPLFKICLEVAEKVGTGLWPDLTRGCDHYHATSCKPSWANPDKIKLRLGHHIFYNLS
jgi:N-acetylmuramoyl-L-alanine amidase